MNTKLLFFLIQVLVGIIYVAAEHGMPAIARKVLPVQMHTVDNNGLVASNMATKVAMFFIMFGFSGFIIGIVSLFLPDASASKRDSNYDGGDSEDDSENESDDDSDEDTVADSSGDDSEASDSMDSDDES